MLGGEAVVDGDGEQVSLRCEGLEVVVPFGIFCRSVIECTTVNVDENWELHCRRGVRRDVETGCDIGVDGYVSGVDVGH